jgi:hypothetical protein
VAVKEYTRLVNVQRQFRDGVVTHTGQGQEGAAHGEKCSRLDSGDGGPGQRHAISFESEGLRELARRKKSGIFCEDRSELGGA